MKLRVLFILISLIFSLSPNSIQAQDGGADADIIQTSLRDFGVVGGCTALGALLGASTLSFVEEPTDHLKNILVGGAVGVIAGVAIVAYIQANKSKEIYKQSYDVSPDFNSAERTAWHEASHKKNTYKLNSPEVFNYQFSF